MDNLVNNMGSSKIEYIYKNGIWNSKYPYTQPSSEGGAGTITYNSDGSFTWKGNARACMVWSNLPTGKFICVKYKPISDVIALVWEAPNNNPTYSQRLHDNGTTTGNIYRINTMQIVSNNEPYLYISGNYYSYNIYEIFITEF